MVDERWGPASSDRTPCLSTNGLLMSRNEQSSRYNVAWIQAELPERLLADGRAGVLLADYHRSLTEQFDAEKAVIFPRFKLRRSSSSRNAAFACRMDWAFLLRSKIAQ